jgi:hypothetical protein
MLRDIADAMMEMRCANNSELAPIWLSAWRSALF